MVQSVQEWYRYRGKQPRPFQKLTSRQTSKSNIFWSLFVVNSTGCAPIIRAFEEGTQHAELWEGAKTVADGLRVPVAVGDFLILQAIRESGGTAVAVEDSDMIKYTKVMGRNTGIFPAPEGAACLAAQVKLLENRWIKPDETVVLFNTGTGLKYAHVYA